MRKLLDFRKSSFSQSGNYCVEVAFSDDDIFVRDSKDRSGPALKFTSAEWQAFLKGVKNREFEVK